MRPFRFGAVSVVRGDARAWGDAARRLEDDGYSALLVPDTLWTPSPFLALTAAGAATRDLRLGTWVLAAPLRSPAATVRDTRTLVDLSGGRFELGLGAGRPGGEQDAEKLGVPWGSGPERVSQVEATIAAVRESIGDDLPITLAASGDRMLRLAGRNAQTVALPLGPNADLAAVVAAAERVRAATPEGREPLELSLQVVGVGDDVPEWMRRNMGITPEDLRAAGAVGLMTGEVGADADTLLTLRERAGVSFVTIPGDYTERLRPLVVELAGR